MYEVGGLAGLVLGSEYVLAILAGMFILIAILLGVVIYLAFRYSKVCDDLIHSKRSESNLFESVKELNRVIEHLENTRVVINISDQDPDAVVIDR